MEDDRGKRGDTNYQRLDFCEIQHAFTPCSPSGQLLLTDTRYTIILYPVNVVYKGSAWVGKGSKSTCSIQYPTE